MSDAALVTCAGRARLSRVEQIMGMPVTIEVCDAGVDEEVVERVYRWLRYVDVTFSTYDPTSEISRLNRGELQLADAGPAVRSVLERCAALRQQTDGYFDIRAPMASGGVDPSGLVKGWAVLGGARLLEQAGVGNFCIDAGGDIVVRGEAPQGGSWRIGIAHPFQHGAIARTVALRDAAIATSGTYARGRHIIDPRTGATPGGLLSVTVIGPDIAVADAFATAAFAMGREAPEWCVRQKGWHFMLVTDNEEVLTTAGFERYTIPEAIGSRPRSRPRVTYSTSFGHGTVSPDAGQSDRRSPKWTLAPRSQPSRHGAGTSR